LRIDTEIKEIEMDKKQILSKLERERATLKEAREKLEAGDYTTKAGKPIPKKMLEGAIRSKERGIKRLEKQAGLA
jgi:hypothetical protein